MNRRGFLARVIAIPVAAAAATIGIKASPPLPPTTGVLRLPNNMAIAARNAGVVSIETVLGHFNMPDGMRKHYMATILERSKILDYTVFDREEDVPIKVMRWKKLP